MTSEPELRPAWRRGERRSGEVESEAAPAAEAPPSPPLPPDEAEYAERGRTLALLAALGRLQMSIDVLTRQQQRHAEAVEERLARIERLLPGAAE